MMSMRVLARSAPRNLTRLSSAALRQSVVARPTYIVRSLPWAPLGSSQLTSSFSTTPLRREPEGEVDADFSRKLEQEASIEEELKEGSETPSSITDFLEHSPFELIDTPGQVDVYLKRQFGNETITVSFSISDLAEYNAADPYPDDDALTDEGYGTPEQTAGEAEEAAEQEEDDEMAPPARVNIVVEKEGQKGALNIEAHARDGSIMVENFYYFPDAAMAHSTDAETAHKANDTFLGPPFGTLDEDLQILLERYLEERGITQSLAVFIPDYMDMKEQREYHAWLGKVKAFVDA